MQKKVLVSFAIALLFFAIWSVIMIVLLQLPVNRSQLKPEWETITNAQYNFSVDYPTKWVARTYDEHGARGAKAIKLQIYRSFLGYFQITVYYQSASKPTLEDVALWGETIINSGSRSLEDRGEKPFEKLTLQEDTVNGQEVLRRIYQGGGTTNEDVYIARANDMIIISLQSEEEDFDTYLEDFERIVQSFRPLE